MKIPIEERREFGKWFYAYECFHCAKLQLQELIEFKEKGLDIKNDRKYKNMMTSFFATYSKPFKANYGIGKIGKEIVSNEYLELHDHIIHYRDKLFIHGDLNNRITEQSEDMDKIVFNKRNGEFSWQLMLMLPNDHRFKEYLKLVNHVFMQSKYYVEKFNAKWNIIISSLPDGLHELNLRIEGEKPFMKLN